MYHEIIQRDAYFQTPLKYFLNDDKQLEILLQKIFTETTDEISEEARYHLMMYLCEFVQRSKKISIFFEHFMRQESRLSQTGAEFTCLHSQQLNVAQRVTDNEFEFSNSKRQVFYLDLEDRYFN